MIFRLFKRCESKVWDETLNYHQEQYIMWLGMWWAGGWAGGEGTNQGFDPGFEPNGGEGLRISSGSCASGGTHVSRSEIEESIFAINRQDN
ncbi:hypothetical protein E3N88_06497 [Mikania micrantha]|uniref:Uncharacterized protein n=1 Tax=Mikania micrantha TaxID=192012 RepID=A0A5N6PPP1_9ASTR|nr:hypothetical protein E3N88_06497 [Mikania micrantha]